MKLLMNILYMVTMGAIRVWRMLLYVITYICFTPIRAYIIKISKAVGIRGSSEPSSIIIHNEMVYHRIAYEGTFGLGESYMEGLWDCKKLDVLTTKAVLGGLYQKSMPWDRLINYLEFDLFNLQTRERSSQLMKKHYDLGKHSDVKK